MEKDKKNLSFISLQEILSGKGGPDIDEYFNLYYVHWWTPAHFLFHYHGGVYQPRCLQPVKRGGGPVDFRQLIGRLEEVERQWYGYVLELKKSLHDKRTPAVRLTTAAPASR